MADETATKEPRLPTDPKAWKINHKMTVVAGIGRWLEKVPAGPMREEIKAMVRPMFAPESSDNDL